MSLILPGDVLSQLRVRSTEMHTWGGREGGREGGRREEERDGEGGRKRG